MTTRGKIINVRSGISNNEKKTKYVIVQVQEEDGTSYNLPLYGEENYSKRDEYKIGRPVTLKTSMDFRFNGTISIVL